MRVLIYRVDVLPPVGQPTAIYLSPMPVRC